MSLGVFILPFYVYVHVKSESSRDRQRACLCVHRKCGCWAVSASSKKTCGGSVIKRSSSPSGRWRRRPARTKRSVREQLTTGVCVCQLQPVVMLSLEHCIWQPVYTYTEDYLVPNKSVDTNTPPAPETSFESAYCSLLLLQILVVAQFLCCLASPEVLILTMTP